jgi:hypothetical protein
LIDRVQRRRPDLKAFYGQDLHWRQQYAELFNEIDTSSGARGEVLAALRAGGFTGVKDTLRLPSNGRIPAEQMHELARISARSQRFRSAVQSIRKLLGSAVKRMPAPIKARLRRIF